MIKYEYKAISKGMPLALNDKKSAETAQDLEEELNRLGAEGWEFIQWKDTMLIFRREF